MSLTNSPPGAGQLQVGMHGDMPFVIVGTGEDGSHGGERGGRHCVSVSHRQSSASECESGEEEKHSVLVKALVNPSPPVSSMHCISLASRCTVVVHTISV